MKIRRVNYWSEGVIAIFVAALLHITPSANHAELVGQLDHAFTDHEYPPMVGAAGEVVQEHVYISAANLQPGMIRWCAMRVSMQSRSRNWSWTRHWGGNSAL